MVILNIDTSVLRSSVSVAEQTNDAIAEAESLLNAITVHDDWRCTERERIKEMTLNNKAKAQEIRNHGQAFYTAIKTASEKFDAAEQESCTRINGVDDVISKVVNVVPGITSVAFGGEGAGSDISIVDFNNLSRSLEE